ncbi:endo alpha-1,4 polygalactosaminidase [Streptosporangiaceae bacterium NEAU-GS5]|nr:endo alpha-1,4 polygalactosaminidase [Streptosporangiaceae bacterium NEAU-GS5]
MKWEGRRSSLTACALALAAVACADGRAGAQLPQAPQPSLSAVRSFVYQLQRYTDDRLDAIAGAPQPLAIIDLSRDGTARGAFTAAEIARLRGAGKLVLAYFEIGSIEEFRDEWGLVRRRHPDLVLNRWAEWPDEHFVRYWDPRWWDSVVRPRADQALRAGFDGVYLDTPLAYEEIDLAMARGESRHSLGRRMVDLIIRISAYARSRRPGFLIVPQNSPELRHFSGYTQAIDGIGMEELFFRATDRPCDEDWCAENLAEAVALRRQGKPVLATDYAERSDNLRAACALYRTNGFAGNVTVPALDRISSPCD